MKKIVFILIAAIAVCPLHSCSPRSYCFFSPKENKLFISKDTSRIKSVTIIKPGNITIYKQLDPPEKDYYLTNDSVVNKAIQIIITTTDFRDRYMLKLNEEDWTKDKIFKCRYLIR